MVKIKDVAQRANVSPASVSRYLNAPDILKPETAERIKQAIEELHYTPNPLAVGMRTGSTKSIALVIPTLTNLYYVDLYGAIYNACREQDYTVNLYTTEQNRNLLLQYAKDIPSKHYEGVIVCFLDELDMTEALRQMNSQVPVVLITSDPSKSEFHNVFVDAMDGLRQATSHVIDLGHKRIAFAGGGKSSHIIIQEKLSGYRLAMERAGLPVEDSNIFIGTANNVYTGVTAARHFISQPPIPDAIVCATDDIAIGCTKYLLQSGLSIPGDVAVAGFNGISLTDYFEPSITTVKQPITAIGESAVDLLFKSIQNPRANKMKRVFTAEMKIGKSTDMKAPAFSFDEMS